MGPAAPPVVKRWRRLVSEDASPGRTLLRNKKEVSYRSSRSPDLGSPCHVFHDACGEVCSSCCHDLLAGKGYGRTLCQLIGGLCSRWSDHEGEQYEMFLQHKAKSSVHRSQPKNLTHS